MKEKMGRKKARARAKAKPKKELPDTIKEIVLRISSEPGYEIVKALADQELTDEELAKRTRIRINLVRKILYDLYENRVVNYRRTRDESTGWYIYHWHLEPERALEYLNTTKRMLLKKLEERLEQERNSMFFSCEKACFKLSFEAAVENDFKCPKCEGRLESYDNSNVINALERQIEMLKQELARPSTA